MVGSNVGINVAVGVGADVDVISGGAGVCVGAGGAVGEAWVIGGFPIGPRQAPRTSAKQGKRTKNLSRIICFTFHF